MTRRAALLAAILLISTVLCSVSPRAWSQEKAQEQARPVRYAEIEVRGPILETLPDLYLVKPETDTLYELVGRIDSARRDPAVHGLVLKLQSLGTGWAKAQELRQAIVRFRKAGKPVICFVESCGNLDYYVATSASRIVMVPSGSLLLVGLRAEVLFLKGLLEKLGVEADMVQVGEAKGAEEPFTRTTASEPFRRSINALLDDYYQQLVEGISAGRGLRKSWVRKLLDDGPYSARRARDAGLVDELRFYDELIQSLRQQHGEGFTLLEGYGGKQQASPFGANPQDLLKLFLGGGGQRPDRGLPQGPTIAVVYAVGTIVSDDPGDVLLGENVVNARRLCGLLGRLRKEDSVKAVVLRVDSPGGSAEASDLIWHELRRLDEVKPVVVSLSDVAGSGGYYIAAGGRKILAQEGTVTGSIGVVGGKFVLSGLFEKLGLTVDVYQRGEQAGLFSSVERLSERQRLRLRELLLDARRTFLERIRASRGQLVRQPELWSEGQTITGSQALSSGLIDAIGGLSDAIDVARDAAGLPEGSKFNVVRLPPAQSLLDVILWGKREVRTPAWLLRLPLQRRDLPVLGYVGALGCLQDYRPAALMPVWITVR